MNGKRFVNRSELGYKVGPRLRESRLVAPSGRAARAHASTHIIKPLILPPINKNTEHKVISDIAGIINYEMQKSVA